MRYRVWVDRGAIKRSEDAPFRVWDEQENKVTETGWVGFPAHSWLIHHPPGWYPPPTPHVKVKAWIETDEIEVSQ